MNPEALTEEELFLAFSQGKLPKEGFGHRAHVRVGWWLMHQDPATAADRLQSAIDGFTKAHGLPDVYHQTITQGWLRVLQVAQAVKPATTFSEFAGLHPELLDSSYLGRFWSPELLRSPAAKKGWVDPDLQPLP